MLPLFNSATARGELVYWRDDTHWNDRGINLAAEAVWAKMTNLQQGLIERPE